MEVVVIGTQREALPLTYFQKILIPNEGG